VLSGNYDPALASYRIGMEEVSYTLTVGDNISDLLGENTCAPFDFDLKSIVETTVPPIF
jgi:hypothetical protein